MNRCRDTTLDTLMISNGTALSEHVVAIVADEQMQRHYIGHTDDIKWYCSV